MPPLREMEAYVFDHMVRLLWRALVEVSSLNCTKKTPAMVQHGLEHWAHDSNLSVQQKRRFCLCSKTMGAPTMVAASSRDLISRC